MIIGCKQPQTKHRAREKWDNSRSSELSTLDFKEADVEGFSSNQKGMSRVSPLLTQ